MKYLSMKDVETQESISTCGTGRGEIKAEGVVGLACGFL
jgi:hypothetical protein